MLQQFTYQPQFIFSGALKSRNPVCEIRGNCIAKVSFKPPDMLQGYHSTSAHSTIAAQLISRCVYHDVSGVVAVVQIWNRRNNIVRKVGDICQNCGWRSWASVEFVRGYYTSSNFLQLVVETKFFVGLYAPFNIQQ